jgi:hypothetical protein
MKKIFLSVAMLIFILPAIPRVNGAEVSVDLFYNNLSGGNWIEVGDYGYGWQPDVAVSDSNWRPYADGYWAYTDVGWTWVSYEDFGWATYHYGRWARLADYGWVWFPGSDLEWGPAWVSWRTGGDYVGWAPLPPRGPGIVYEGRPISGRVDVEFDIGPAYYNFVDVRYIGEPVLRSHIYAPTQNVTYINQTVNVTNITYQNNVVYNYGPDYNVLSAHSSRPIQRLNIERQANVDVAAAAKTGSLTKVQGDKLVVAAPAKIQKSTTAIAPPTVKTKVAQPKLERGWTGVSNEAELKQKMKTEDLKKVAPPTGAGAAAGAAPAATAAPMIAPAGPSEKGKRKGERGQVAQPGTPASPGATAAGALASPAIPLEKGKHKGERGQVGQPGATVSPSTGAAGALGSPAATPFAPERGKQKGKRGELGTSPAPPYGPPERNLPPGQTGAAPVAPEATQPPTKHKGQLERGVTTPAPGQPGGISSETEQGKHKGRQLEQAGTPPVTGGEPPLGQGGGKHKVQGVSAEPGNAPAAGGPPEAQGGQHKVERPVAQPSAPVAGGPAGQERGQGKPEGGKKKAEKVSPTPGPQ